MSIASNTVIGTESADKLYGSASSDVIDGAGGEDTLYGGAAPDTTVDIDVTFASETASFRNAIGVYEIAPDGTISNVSIVFADASAVKGGGGSLVPGQSTVTVTVDASSQVGFFLLPNGGSPSSVKLLTATEGHYELRTASGEPATTATVGGASLWYVAPDGKAQMIQTTQGSVSFHTAAVSDNDYGLNGDATDHTQTTIDPKTGNVVIGFEDNWKGGDKDYNDVIITVNTSGTAVTVADPDLGAPHPATIDDDTIYGGAGSDSIYGQGGADMLFGGIGSDMIEGGAESDTIFGGDASDTLYGGDGADIVNGDAASDLIYGGKGADDLHGGNGNDEIYGDTGDDVINGESGLDTLSGGEGNDGVFGGKGSDTINGGKGNDSASGGDGADLIFGDSGNDVVIGHGGNDTIYGGDGDDQMDGGILADLLYGGKGDDNMIGGDGTDILYGDSGNDDVMGGAADDVLYGGTGDDFIYGQGGFDTIFGGEGHDVMQGNEGNDSLDGYTGNDTLSGSTGTDILSGGAGDDVLSGGEGWDTFVFETQDMGDWTDKIIDFAFGEDMIDLSNLLLVDAAFTAIDFLTNNMSLAADGKVVIAIDAQEIEVTGVGTTTDAVQSVWDQILFA